MGNPILRLLPIAAALLALPAAAATPAERGKRFFNAAHGGDWSCARERTFRSRAVTSAANCGACHTRAGEGSFREREIRVPR